MLNPFPSLLVYGFFTPTLLRVAVAIYFVYIAQFLAREEKKLEAIRVPLVGQMRAWMVWLSVVVTTLVAFCLFVGYETQWAAIVGMLISLKHLYGTRKYASYLPLSRGTYILLFIICLSLLYSGAGAMAFDLPL